MTTSYNRRKKSRMAKDEVRRKARNKRKAARKN